MTDSEYRDAIEKVNNISIFDLAEKLYPGVELSDSCRSPFRDDRVASFSVRKDGKLWNDFGSGEGGTAMHFYMKAMDCDKSSAFKALLEMVQGYQIEASPTVRRVREAVVKVQVHPELEVPSEEELCTIGGLRHLWSIGGLEVAVERGFLWTSIIREQRAFVITDKTRRSYMARRMDGLPWERANDRGRTLKSLTLTGSDGNWPVGILEANDYAGIAVCEGGPDFLTAFHLAWVTDVSELIAPVCMSGASVKNIPREAYLCFMDKRVRIFAHNDAPGRKGAEEWRKLAHLARFVDIYSFEGKTKKDGSKVIDLNDAVEMKFNRETVSDMMRFIYE